ncbi:MAG: hypothetical protein WKF59_18065 [Chitinophagaceae bacterium]
MLIPHGQGFGRQHFPTNYLKNIIDKTPFGNIEFGVFGRNLFLWTKEYKHLDPEQNALGISPAQGLEFNANPSTRTLGFNLRLTL